SLTERVMRRWGTLASASACAVRSTIRSWKEKRHALRGPRVGETNPAAISARMVLRGRRSSFSTSRTPYCCMTRLPRKRSGFFAGLARGGHRRLGHRFRALGRLAGGFRLGARRRGGAFFQARAERVHEVDDLGAGLWLFGQRDLLAFDLLLDRGLDALR